MIAMAKRPELTEEKIAQRIAEGIEATETKIFQHEGEIIESAPRVAWTARHQFLDLYGKFSHLLKPQDGATINQLFLNLTEAQLAQIAQGKATPDQFLNQSQEETNAGNESQNPPRKRRKA